MANAWSEPVNFRAPKQTQNALLLGTSVFDFNHTRVIDIKQTKMDIKT